MNTVIFGTIDRIKVQVECPVQFVGIFKDNLFVCESVGAPDVHMVLHDDRKDLGFDADFLSGINFQYRHDGFCFKTSHFEAAVYGLFAEDEGCRIDVAPLSRGGLAGLLQKMVQAGSSSLRQQRIVLPGDAQEFPLSVMSYSLFWFVIHCTLMKKDASFIHASTLERNGRAILLAGTGGCGKTSTTFRLLEDNSLKYRYLSEDFSIVSQWGEVFLNPKTLSIYASDLRGDPSLLLKYANKHLSVLEKRLWLRACDGGHLNPMRKVPLSHVLEKEQLCVRAPIGAALFLSRGQYKSLTSQPIEVAEYAERCTDASFRELKTLCEIITQGRAVACDQVALPTIEKFRGILRKSYLKAFESAPCHLVAIPRETPPQDLAGFVAAGEWW